MADADPKIEKQKAGEEIVMSPAAATEIPPEPIVVESKAKRSFVRPLLMFGVPALILAVVGYFWLTSGGTVSTDNAYVQQDKVSVSSDVAGRIIETPVRENQLVKAGDVLFRIDPEPYRIQVLQANAAIANAQVELQTLQASYQGTGSDIQAARDRIAQAQEDFNRQAELMKRGFTTRASYLASQHAVEQARASLQSAESSAAEARSKLATGAAVPGENPAIAAAQVQRERAMLDLSRTTVRAPTSGIISQTKSLQVGQQMITGLPAVTIVSDKPAWVEANFKETDLTHMKPGQTATVDIDIYPDTQFEATVNSLSPGTGLTFSLLPPENATGNWVKVVQRLPVRLSIKNPDPSHPLHAGLSATVEVDTHHSRPWLTWLQKTFSGSAQAGEAGH